MPASPEPAPATLSSAAPGYSREPARIPVGRFILKLDPAVVNHVVLSVRCTDGTHNQRQRLVEHDLVELLDAELRRRNTAAVDRMRDPGRDGLRHLLRRFGGDEQLALAGYFQGPETVQRGDVLASTHACIADVLALKSRV